MPRGKVVRGARTTRQEILAVATKRFAAASYDDVSLRDIAGDVGVDVAYVHRSFGSKEQLFREVLNTHRVENILSGVNVEEIPALLAKRTIERERPEDASEPDPVLIMIHSLASVTAGRLVGEVLQSDFIEPLREKIGDASPFRASLVMSMLIGFSILRNLLQLSAATNLDPALAEEMTANAIEGILNRVIADGAG